MRVPTEPGFCLPYLVKSDFYICLPPGTYSEGFNIKVVRADGGSVEKTFSGPVTIERNKVYTYEMDVPSLHSKFVTAVCNGKEIQVRCTQLWKGGPYWAELNIGMEDYSGNNWGSKFAWGGKVAGNQDDYYIGSGNLGDNANTAYYLWGDNWRMPESKEIHPLFDKYYTYYTEAK